MAINVWPIDLPQRLLGNSFAEATADNTLRSDVDRGVAKVRRKSSALSRPLAGSMMLTDEQLQSLLAFEDSHVGVPFRFPQPRAGQTWLVRFDPPIEWTWQPMRACWLVNLKFEILP